MSRKNTRKMAVVFLNGCLGLGLMYAGCAMAAGVTKIATENATFNTNNFPPVVDGVVLSADMDERTKTREPDGGGLRSKGGFSYASKDEYYWVKFSGVVRLDETVFMGGHRDIQNNFPSGANLRKLQTAVDGGVGPDWEYTLQLNFEGRTVVRFDDTWVAYDGFVPYNEVFIGRVPGYYYGLDNANSGTWNPFLERSLVANSFYPGDGLGVMTDFFGPHWGLTLVASQPDHGLSPLSPGTIPSGAPIPSGANDRWRGIARLTIAPVNEPGNIWHFGVSAAYRARDSGIRVLGTTPSTTGRNPGRGFLVSTFGLVNTANRAAQFALEAARQCGPFMLEGEYQALSLHRPNTFAGTAKFHGWNIQARYLLTGGYHEYDVRDGGFGGVTPIPECGGAWEVAARYDFVNLDDKDVRGGSEHDVTLGLNWFVNDNVRFSCNYIKADIHPANNQAQRWLDILGFRVQFRFK